MRRPAVGFVWRALALHVGPALLAPAPVQAALALHDRLPRHPALA